MNGSLPIDGGWLPRELACCGGTTWAVVRGATADGPEGFVVFEEHALWCCVAAPFSPPGLTARL